MKPSSSIVKKTRQLALKFTALSIVISLAAMLVLFIAQAKVGLIHEVSRFLILGQDNLLTIERELGYDEVDGYEYAAEHLKAKFGFSKIEVTSAPDLSCILKRRLYEGDSYIDICLKISPSYKLIKELDTLKGQKFLILKKPHSFSANTFKNFSLVVLSLIVMMVALFLWFYREVMKVTFFPFYSIYTYLTEGDESRIDVSLEEVDKLYSAIKQRSILEKEILELEKSSAVFKAIATTTQMVSHDVRRPLVMVANFMRKVAALSTDSILEYTKRNADVIEKATEDAYGMLEDLTSFSPTKANIFPEPIELEKFFTEIAEELSIEKIKISTEGNDVVELDRLKIKRVIINILKNALEATDGKGSYWISSWNNGNGLKIEVGNIGSSIPKERLPTIFEPFVTSKKVTSHGLGMAIAKKFTEDHGGSISCESNGWPKGGDSYKMPVEKDYVLFTLILPC